VKFALPRYTRKAIINHHILNKNNQFSFTYLYRSKSMRRLFALILVICLWFGAGLTTAPAALADFNTLTPCGSSSAFKERQATTVSGLQERLAKFQAGTPQRAALESTIAQTNARFAKYGSSSLLCGEDGLPHLIADGRWSHAGDFMIPGLMFLYITGWIGWVGRDYLRAVRKDPDTACEKEIIIDVPLAIKFMLTGFIWPMAALKEFGTGELLAPDKEVTVSPR
jgi:photosystem I subunit III